jgi:hypothetical protein
MPKPSDYTPARRLAMQTVMWVILGTTVALAAWVDQSQRRARHVELSAEVIHSASVSLRLPAKWRTRAGDDDPRLIADATEGESGSGAGSGAGAGAREIWILRDRLEIPISPGEYLARSFGLTFDDEESSGRWPARVLNVANVPGLLVTSVRPLPRRGEDAMQKDLFACAVLPSLQVIVVHLQGFGAPAPSDDAVVREVARTIVATDQPAPDALTHSLALEGMTISNLPRPFKLIAQTDPLRTDRRLQRCDDASAAANQFERDWTSCELVPCLFPMPQAAGPLGARDGISAPAAGEASIAAEAETPLAAEDANRLEAARLDSAFAALLLVRDGSWRNARIVRDASDRWHAEPAAPREGPAYSARAYLLAGRSGRALLAIFHGGLGADVDEFDSMWGRLAASVTFSSQADSGALEKAGVAQVDRFKKLGLGQLLDDRSDRWWQLLDFQDPHPHQGWVHMQWGDNLWGGRFETRRRKPMRHVRSMMQEWESQPDLTAYACDATRSDTLDGSSASDAVMLHTDTRGGKLSVRIARRDGAVARSEGPLPRQFVPGPALIQLLGNLSDRPMLLRTDSFIGCDGLAGGGEPLTLIIRPISAAALSGSTFSSRNPASCSIGARSGTRTDASVGRRCLSISVNGSGQISRWFFDGGGQFVDAELAGGRRWIRSQPRDIRFNFGASGPMAP